MNDSKDKIDNNLVMELKNDNLNGWNVIINNLHPMIWFFFQKYWNWVR